MDKDSINHKNDIFEDIINYVIENKPDKDTLAKKKVEFCRQHKAKKIPTDIEVLLHAKREDIKLLRQYLTTKPVRTGSGVAVIAIMSAPFRCPHGKCTYCPGGPDSSFGNVPQSYTGHEPATMRGIRNDYDAFLQVMNRLEQYVAIGQNPDKVELIIMGGTFPSFDVNYQEEFVRDAFLAMNTFSEMFYDYENDGLDDLNIAKFKEFFLLPGEIGSKSRTKSIKEKLLEIKKIKKKGLKEVQDENENAKIRCIGLTIETKPDWGFQSHGEEMLKLGCTRVELGIQTLNNEVLHKIHRGHDLDDAKKSIKELRNLGFKLNFHMMPGLPGVSKEEDVATFKELFENDSYKPDMLKIYPTMVMPGTQLYNDYEKGKYEPLSTMQAADIIASATEFVPKYCRIMRVQRDIPTKYSKGGVDKNNLRQLVEDKIKEKGIKLQDIRAREIAREKIALPIDFEIIEYQASEGKEAFISLVDKKDKLLGFCRLRIFKDVKTNTVNGIIRELHVYGHAVAVGEDDGNAQHKGYGRRLMAKAEIIAKKNKVKELLVISGIGVRNYYKKLGYNKKDTYMTKIL